MVGVDKPGYFYKVPAITGADDIEITKPIVGRVACHKFRQTYSGTETISAQPGDDDSARN
jgi:hypothetical protein